MTHRATRRPQEFVRPAYWNAAPPPEPASVREEEEGTSPTRYGDWVKAGIAIDF